MYSPYESYKLENAVCTKYWTTFSKPFVLNTTVSKYNTVKVVI